MQFFDNYEQITVLNLKKGISKQSSRERHSQSVQVAYSITLNIVFDSNGRKRKGLVVQSGMNAAFACYKQK